MKGRNENERCILVVERYHCDSHCGRLRSHFGTRWNAFRLAIFDWVFNATGICLSVPQSSEGIEVKTLTIKAAKARERKISAAMELAECYYMRRIEKLRKVCPHDYGDIRRFGNSRKCFICGKEQK